MVQRKVDIFDLNSDKRLKEKSLIQALLEMTRGVERECLRVTQTGKIAETPHPKFLGSNLTHPLITTDYSEALLEFITPSTQSLQTIFKILTELYQYTYQHLQEEYLWPCSMPCTLPKEEDIPVAEYGNSNMGRLKHIYRLGLGARYGRRMQTIAGIHYNFSFSDNFWIRYAKYQKANQPLQTFISEQYIALIRNAFRLGWILPLFFGASPAVSSDFLEKPDFGLQRLTENTYYLPYATSLRLSDIGYHNKDKPRVKISYDSFPDFLRSMHQAIHTVEPQFQRLGIKQGNDYLQLSDSVLQIENEHYAAFRPKRVTEHGKRMLQSLQEKGIEYIEVRALDVNPFLPLGLDEQTAYFLECFLILCLLMPSPLLTEDTLAYIEDNNKKVVTEGRHPEAFIWDEQGNKRPLQDYAYAILTQMETIATVLDEALDEPVYKKAISLSKEQLKNNEQLPSARLLKTLKHHNLSFLDFGIEKAVEYKKYFNSKPWSAVTEELYSKLSVISLKQAETIQDQLPFEVFLKQYLEI